MSDLKKKTKMTLEGSHCFESYLFARSLELGKPVTKSRSSQPYYEEALNLLFVSYILDSK